MNTPSQPGRTNAAIGRRWRWVWGLLVCLAAVARGEGDYPVERLSANLSVMRGPVNGVLLHQNGKYLAVYGWPGAAPGKIEEVLFTHHSREVAWAGIDLVRQGARAVIPGSESFYFLSAGQFWDGFLKTRFHNYRSLDTHVLMEPLRDAILVGNENGRYWERIDIRALGTPGFTPGASSYLFAIDGLRVACVGDLIYGDGQLLSLPNLQDAISETGEDGYHGYGARAAEVLASLRRILEWGPDVLIPARGPVIRNPKAAVEKLTQRLQAVFASHFAVDALRWYRGEEKWRKQQARILGTGVAVAPMPAAAVVQTNLPKWIVPVMNSRLLLSESGGAFLVDCGNPRILQELAKLEKQGRFKTIEGLYLTHYHDDHTDMAARLARQYHCPVYACRELKDVLEHPGAYCLPALTANYITNVQAMAEGAKQRWHEFEFTYSYFPGQTLYHGALLAKKDGGETVFFIGDSFTPTGLDDYCLYNRNLFPPAKGYADCLEILQGMGSGYLLINQHVPPAFWFDAGQVANLRENFAQRRQLMAELFPWDDPNFGVDAQWARFYPYGSEMVGGQTNEVKLLILNHSPVRQEFRITPRFPTGWKGDSETVRLELGPREEGGVAVRFAAPTNVQGGAIITADIAFGPWDLRQWSEALVNVTRPIMPRATNGPIFGVWRSQGDHPIRRGGAERGVGKGEKGGKGGK